MNKIEKQSGFFRLSESDRAENKPISKELYKTKIIRSIVLFSITLVFLGILIPNWVIIRLTHDYVHSLDADIKKSDVGIILGASVYKEKVSSIVNDRIVTAVNLYRKGKVSRLLVSGDHGQKYYNEISAITYWLDKYNIPAKDIMTDHSGFSTYESMYNAKIKLGVKNAVIITQEFHLPRAIYIARALGINAQGLCADQRRYRNIRWYTFREYLARVKDFIKVHMYTPGQI